MISKRVFVRPKPSPQDMALAEEILNSVIDITMNELHPNSEVVKSIRQSMIDKIALTIARHRTK